MSGLQNSILERENENEKLQMQVEKLEKKIRDFETCQK